MDRKILKIITQSCKCKIMLPLKYVDPPTAPVSNYDVRERRLASMRLMKRLCHTTWEPIIVSPNQSQSKCMKYECNKFEYSFCLNKLTIYKIWQNILTTVDKRHSFSFMGQIKVAYLVPLPNTRRPRNSVQFFPLKV